MMISISVSSVIKNVYLNYHRFLVHYWFYWDIKILFAKFSIFPQVQKKYWILNFSCHPFILKTNDAEGKIQLKSLNKRNFHFSAEFLHVDRFCFLFYIVTGMLDQY